MANIRGLSWYNKQSVQKAPHNEFLGELEWINANIAKSGFNPNQVDRLRKYRAMLEIEYQNRRARRWS